MEYEICTKGSKISWLTTVLTLDAIKHVGATPPDDMSPQIVTDCAILTLDFKHLAFSDS